MNGYTWKPTDVDPYVLGDTEFSYLEDITPFNQRFSYYRHQSDKNDYSAQRLFTREVMTNHLLSPMVSDQLYLKFEEFHFAKRKTFSGSFASTLAIYSYLSNLSDKIRPDIERAFLNYTKTRLDLQNHLSFSQKTDVNRSLEMQSLSEMVNNQVNYLFHDPYVEDAIAAATAPLRIIALTHEEDQDSMLNRRLYWDRVYELAHNNHFSQQRLSRTNIFSSSYTRIILERAYTNLPNKFSRLDVYNNSEYTSLTAPGIINRILDLNLMLLYTALSKLIGISVIGGQYGVKILNFDEWSNSLYVFFRDYAAYYKGQCKAEDVHYPAPMRFEFSVSMHYPYFIRSNTLEPFEIINDGFDTSNFKTLRQALFDERAFIEPIDQQPFKDILCPQIWNKLYYCSTLVPRFDYRHGIPNLFMDKYKTINAANTQDFISAIGLLFNNCLTTPAGEDFLTHTAFKLPYNEYYDKVGHLTYIANRII